ncbi:MAG TPA: shikimate kinase [Tepidisphaeraceae bacterium]
MGVVLMGYRGCGKTSIGRKIADRLWCEFRDTDEMVVAAAGMPIAEIFALRGEAFFRDTEADVLAEALTHTADVVSLGGGAVVRESNQSLIAGAGFSRIYLRCDAEELHRRIHADPATASARPALTAMGGGIDEVRSVLAVREPIYRRLATAELDVTNLSIDEAVIRVTKLI